MGGIAPKAPPDAALPKGEATDDTVDLVTNIEDNKEEEEDVDDGAGHAAVVDDGGGDGDDACGAVCDDDDDTVEDDDKDLRGMPGAFIVVDVGGSNG